MADFSFVCTACQKTLTVDESLVGRDVACPFCSHVMTVPRMRAHLTVKGRPASREVKQADQAAPENLTGLADINAFGDERGNLVVRRRRWVFVQQILAAIGMLLTLVVVVVVAYRFFDARETRKRNLAEAFLNQEEAQEIRRQQRMKARQVNLGARQKQGVWSLTDDDCYRLWRALMVCYPGGREAQAQFDAWVAYDSETYGLFSEVFGQIRKPADIEPACQRLVGMSLGMQGIKAKLPSLQAFRQVALQSLADPD
jgi:DNA-directed RNA polymerase subunit RPC12/RpoP